MKTKEELNALKEEVETLYKKLAELTEEELEEIAGGRPPAIPSENRPNGIYDGIFDGCEGLKPAPGLPAAPIDGKPDDLIR